MVTLRCTQKLLRRLGVSANQHVIPPTTVLGDWYANLYFTRPQQLVICLNERTLLAVLIPARESKTLQTRFGNGVVSLLARLGVPGDAIEAETKAMRDVAFGPTANRRVLGCMNEAAYTLSMELELQRRITAEELELFLSGNIYSPINYREPRELVLELFAASRASSGSAGSRAH